MSNISNAINLAPTSAQKGSCVLKKLEKWEIFNFADFHLKPHMIQLCNSAIETIMYNAIDICIYILELC